MKKYIRMLSLLVAILLLPLSAISCGRGGDGEVHVFYYSYSDT